MANSILGMPQTSDGKQIKLIDNGDGSYSLSVSLSGGGSSVVNSVVAGRDIAVDSSNPAAPIVSLTLPTAAPADGTLSAGQIVFWFDTTNDAARLVIKAKQADGTVVTGEIPLS